MIELCNFLKIMKKKVKIEKKQKKLVVVERL